MAQRSKQGESKREADELKPPTAAFLVRFPAEHFFRVSQRIPLYSVPHHLLLLQ